MIPSLENNLSSILRQTFDVASKDADYMTTFFVEERLSKGDVFLSLDHRCTKMSFIQSGLLRVYAYAEGKEVTQWIGQTGYFMTDLASFILDVPARWQIQALTEVKMLTLSKSDYLRFEKEIPEWNILENRVFDFISLSAEQRYIKFFEQNKALFNQVPLHYIASMLGMTPETFSRIRARLNS